MNPPLGEWSTLAEATDWLNANTSIKWSWRRVLETLKAQYPETVHVVPPIGLPVAMPDDRGHLHNRNWQYPMIMQVSRADEYLRQLLLGDSLETALGYTGALVEPRYHWRAIPTAPLPAMALRLSRHEVYAIADNAEGFDVFVADVWAGKFPELAAELVERDELDALADKAEADAPEPEQEAVPEPTSPLQGRDALLADFVTAVEARAIEQGIPFDRTQWPGTKREFRKFLTWNNSKLAYTLPTDDGRLSDELRKVNVKFARSGRNIGKGKQFYRALFPDWPA
jgi:hypothetical protein